ncbi:MAG: hypothetical protein AB7I09_20195 [Planctomycetota bacterium]
MGTNRRPISVEIDSYQVGFGDCYLLKFRYGPSDVRSVLIDFGTTALPKMTGKSKTSGDYMVAVARDIAANCGVLQMVVATHRHADHISGFATGSKRAKRAKSESSGGIIFGLKPKIVLQPWTEDPKAERDARGASAHSTRSRRSFVAGLAAMHEVAAKVLEIAKRPPRRMSARLVDKLRFLGEDNLKNKSAVDNLIAMGKRRGARAIYARHGMKIALGRDLPGVKLTVLGPPDLTQTESIRKQRKSDPDEFWHLRAGSSRSNVAASGKSAAFARGSKRIPSRARWFQRRLDQMYGAELLEIVRSLDEQMNNTSLILLFEVGTKKLLFPGDAQIENWSYALADAPDHQRTLGLLADVDLYKVGHHGSLNATPRQLLWDAFEKRGAKKGRRMKSLLSTMAGKHGSSESRTEVPRGSLVRALKAETDLTSTQGLKIEKGKPTKVPITLNL